MKPDIEKKEQRTANSWFKKWRLKSNLEVRASNYF